MKKPKCKNKSLDHIAEVLTDADIRSGRPIEYIEATLEGLVKEEKYEMCVGILRSIKKHKALKQ
jgi:hypothetical protein